ncbi:jg11301 [Pararge aegeria aegeria]|uniref:Jg11301 protein n=1 Tax=Pararge aegeria aegeria TaxID=348720 RepID=A0A8S4R6W9_9NEOP|nr:jg11301 [Pararge aegeria aegeria]
MQSFHFFGNPQLTIKSEITDDAKKIRTSKVRKVKCKENKTDIVKMPKTTILKGLTELIKGVTLIPENKAAIVKMPNTTILKGLSETIKRATSSSDDKVTIAKLNKSKAEGISKKVKRPAKIPKNITALSKMPNITIKKIEKPAPISEKQKHCSNLEVILANSNATPIRSHDGFTYMCCFCTDNFVNPSDLKNHTLTIHSNTEDRSKFMKKQTSSGYILKLDITQLKCKLCDKSIDTVEGLFDHLQNEHKQLIYTDVKNQIIPFKFGGEELQCAICPLMFNKYKILLEHMHTHYRNYVCETCDCGFINRRAMLSHKESHKTGSFECSKCNKVFATHQRRRTHINAVHKFMNMPNKCNVCNERFKSSPMKDQHMINVHGMSPVIRKCLACDKTFTNQNALRIHTKKYHLLERNYQCTECEMNFFKGEQLKHHMLKHTGRKDFQCDVCLKWFTRKTVLTEHMRIHTNDRRFTCLQCGRGKSKPVKRSGGIAKTKTVVKPDIVITFVKKERQVPLNGRNMHCANIEAFLKSSTATPIRSHDGFAYTCCFCSDRYVYPADLKSNTLMTHNNDRDIQEYLKKQRPDAFLMKLDITQLKCTEFDENLDTADALLSHLQNVHRRLIFTAVKNEIIPIKFGGEELQCAICPLVFHKYKILLELMHTHYRNHVCEVCDVAFMNRKAMYEYRDIHETGTFECDTCNKVFETLQRTHVKLVHKFMNMPTKSGVCNQRFKSTRTKDQHMATAHGMSPVIRKCSACDRTF